MATVLVSGREVGAVELWDGADVRWIAPARTRGGVRLEPGTPAVVVDAGRHRIRSFSHLYTAQGRPGRHPRPDRRQRRGVVIRLRDGTETRVAPRHLELVAPDHPLRPEPDGRASAWWSSELDGWALPLLVAAFVPWRFPAVCAVVHLDSLGRLDGGTARTLVDVLARATTTPDDVYVAVWEGWGDIPAARFPGAARLDTPHRGHFLLRGPLTGVLTSISARPVGDEPVSGIWWPADRAWFAQTEIDFRFTFVAGTDELVGTLLCHPDLDVVPTTHDAPVHELERDLRD